MEINKKAPKGSLKTKLIVMYIALVLIVMAVAGTFILFMIRNNFNTAGKRELESFATKIQEEVIDIGILEDEYLTDEKWVELTDFYRMSSGIQWHLVVASTGETVFSNSERDRSRYQNYHNAVVMAALSGEELFESGNRSEDLNGTLKTWMEYGKPIVNADGSISYVLYVRKDAGDIYESISLTLRTIVRASLIALVIAGILGYLFSSTVTEPIEQLTKRANEVAKGRLGEEIPVMSSDELGQLTETFNYMSKELKETIDDIQREKNKMEIVLYNMTDGVLAYDAEGNIIHSNHVCNNLLDIERHFLPVDTLTLEEFKEKLKIEQENMDEDYSTTLRVGDKYIDASFNTYYSKSGRPSGTIVMLQDVTKHMLLDNMRKEFVANVSHEIRTPLTTVKSYTETLLEGAIDNKEDAKRFLHVIDEEADRMTNLTQDLLELSRFDNEQMTFYFEPVNMVKFIEKQVEQQKIVAEKQKKEIIFDPKGVEMTLSIDKDRMEQVLNNIISNAIKYSEEGSKIEIYLEKTDSLFSIFVKDNGFGIPQEDAERIFERFYRVDKARSRGLGGTGLGLAIAREIVEAHHGTISAASTEGVGTTIIIRFPLLDFMNVSKEEKISKNKKSEVIEFSKDEFCSDVSQNEQIKDNQKGDENHG